MTSLVKRVDRCHSSIASLYPAIGQCSLVPFTFFTALSYTDRCLVSVRGPRFQRLMNAIKTVDYDTPMTIVSLA